MRRQMVSMRQMQSIQPEIKEIQRRYKGDRIKAQQAQAELMKERGISQAGCLMAILPLLLILPMYQVIREGLTAPDPTPMLSVFGIQLIQPSPACSPNSCSRSASSCRPRQIPSMGLARRLTWSSSSSHQPRSRKRARRMTCAARVKRPDRSAAYRWASRT